jgi:3-phosphoinositide dependent protein kinase-1
LALNQYVGLFSRKRQLVLTDAPRLFYIDTDKMVVKGEIPWGSNMGVEFKNDKLFVVTVVWC